MRYSHVCLHTFGYVLPPIMVSSEDLERRLAPVYERLKLPVGRLEMMSGIRDVSGIQAPGPARELSLPGDRLWRRLILPPIR